MGFLKRGSVCIMMYNTKVLGERINKRNSNIDNYSKRVTLK